MHQLLRVYLFHPLLCFTPYCQLSRTGTASAYSGTVVADADTAADPDPIDEQRGCAAAAGKAAVNERVAVNEIGTIDSGISDLNYGKGIVGLPRFINRQRSIGRICTKIVLSRFFCSFIKIFVHFKMPGNAVRTI